MLKCARNLSTKSLQGRSPKSKWPGAVCHMYSSRLKGMVINYARLSSLLLSDSVKRLNAELNDK